MCINDKTSMSQLWFFSKIVASESNKNTKSHRLFVFTLVDQKCLKGLQLALENKFNPFKPFWAHLFGFVNPYELLNAPLDKFDTNID